MKEWIKHGPTHMSLDTQIRNIDPDIRHCIYNYIKGKKDILSWDGYHEFKVFYYNKSPKIFCINLNPDEVIL